jgi:hypothetical protein
MNDPNQALNILIGEELSSIEFVRDYIQFRFDGPCLTAITDPFVIMEHKQYPRSDTGFCNILLGFIGLQVSGTSFKADEIVSIHFSAGRSINISLRPEYLKGRSAEAVNFNNGHGDFWVW